MAFNPNSAANGVGYTLTECLGNGGFGQVWKAEAHDGSEPVAIKFVSGASNAERDILDRIESQNIRHRHLLEIHSATSIEGWLMIVMTLCDTTLKDMLDESLEVDQAGLDSRTLLTYTTQAAEAIDYLVESGLTHRDVKSANIFLKNGEVMVGDLGLMKLLPDASNWHSRHSLIPYGAPESYSGQVTDTSDQYSLALTYVELRCGKLPFEGKHVNEIIDLKLKGELSLDALDPGEEVVVRKALSPDPKARFGSCREFADQLAEAFETKDPLADANGKGHSTGGAPSAESDERSLLELTENRLYSMLVEEQQDEEANEPADQEGAGRAKPFVEGKVPQSAADYVDIARQCLASGHYRDASEYFAEAITHGDSSAETRLGLAEALFEATDFAQAILAYNAVIPSLSKKSDVYHRRGQAYQKLGKEHEAIEDFKRAIEHSNPLTQRKARAQYRASLAESHTTRGIAFLERDDLSKAIDDFTKAVEIDRHLVEAYYYRGKAFTRSENFTTAIDDFTEAIFKDESNPDLYVARGQAHHAKARDRKQKVKLFRGVAVKESGGGLSTSTSTAEGSVHTAESGLSVESDQHQSGEKDRFHTATGEKPVIFRGASTASVAESRSQTELSRAIDDYNKALGLDEERVDAYCFRAAAKRDLGRHEEAIEDYQQATHREPNHVEALYGLAKVYFDIEQYREAIDLFRHVLRLDGAHVAAYYGCAVAMHQLGLFDEAIEHYSHAISEGSSAGDPFYAKPEPYFNRAEALYCAGHFSQSIADYTRVVEHIGADPVVLYKRGLAYIAAEDTQRAIHDYQKAIELKEDFVEAHTHLADAYQIDEQYPNALLHYAKAQELDENQRDHYGLALASVYLSWGDHLFEQDRDSGKALQKYREAVTRMPRFAPAHGRMGKVYFSEGVYESAIECYTKAIQGASQVPEYYVRRGESYLELEDHTRAIADFCRAIEFEPDSLPAILGRSRALIEQGQHQSAIDDLMGVISSHANHAEAHHLIGRAYHSLEQYEDAILHYCEAVELDSRKADYRKQASCCLRDRGKLRQSEGDLSTAREDFERSIELSPDFGAGYYDLAGIRFELEDYDNALQDANKAFRLGIEDEEKVVGRCYYKIGCQRLDGHDHLEAIDYFTKALNEGLVNGDVYKCRGLSYRMEGRYDHAIDDLENSLSMKPEDDESTEWLGDSYAARGKVHQEEQRLDDALADMLRALETGGDRKETIYEVGLLHHSLGELDEAIEYLRRIDGEYPAAASALAVALRDRGKSLYEQGHLEQAERELSAALEHDQVDAEAFFLRGLVRARLEDLAGRLSDLRAAVDLRDDVPRYRQELAAALCEQGDLLAGENKLESAVTHFSDAMALDGESLACFLGRARARRTMGDHERACEDFEQAFRLLEERDGSRVDFSRAKREEEPQPELVGVADDDSSR
ncbi:Serine/threonine-protein kinase PknI [Planctomycetes bacterium Pan216]|uniref:Serine/threonine-protein kinase PknI n=1 Tax=Kolteria novifilia TaxID=2527975 RepID=A0A518B4R7_9BACT|nr:Serine/threonine-protein kinase PknI [Planctomycetes bacterium Pan216]